MRIYFQSAHFQCMEEIGRPFSLSVIIAAIAGHHMRAPTYIREGYKLTIAR